MVRQTSFQDPHDRYRDITKMERDWTELQIQHGQGTICNEGAGWEPEVRKLPREISGENKILSKLTLIEFFAEDGPG